MAINLCFVFIFLWRCPFACIYDVETFSYNLSNLHFFDFALYKTTNILSMTTTAAIIKTNTGTTTATIRETHNSDNSYI